MCFSHIFPCLSCDEGQVAQIENQEVSKKFISKNLHCHTEKLNSIFAVFKNMFDFHPYIKCILYCLVNRSKIENRDILDVLLRYYILLVYDKIIFF